MHSNINMDSSFDRCSTIESLTVNNLSEIPFQRMLEILSPLVLSEVPEGDDMNSAKRLDFMLSRMANLHAYLRVLWCHATYERARLKKAGKPEEAEDIMKKKEALYELGNAVKLKYEAVSRKVTLKLEDEANSRPEKVDYEARREQRDERASKVATVPIQPKKGGGGWGNIG